MFEALDMNFMFLVSLLILNVIVVLVNRSGTAYYLLALVLGIFTFAFGGYSLTVEGLPFFPYFNLLVIVIGIVTTILSLKGRN